MLQCPPASTARDRLYQVFGDRPDLIELFRESAGLRLTGFVAALAEQGPVRGPQHVFVNRRIVRDRTIAHAISDAYSVATIKERSPEVHLFIEMSPERVDVNVHPTKAEVRFLEPSLVHEVLRRALADTLGRPAVPELQLQATGSVTIGATEPSLRPIPGVFGEPIPAGTGSAMSATGWPTGAGAEGLYDSGPAQPGVHPGSLPHLPGGERSGAGLGQRQSTIDAVRPMVPLGQFRDTYIVAIDVEGLLIIDQHVAHERVLFEQVLERLTTGELESQRLLEPLILELGPSATNVLANHATGLKRLGFEIEDFGAGTLRVSAVPVLVGLETAAGTLRAIADDLDGLDRGARVDEALRRTAATMACHAAVKAHDPLTREKMQYILDELRRTAYSTVCPHGRPVVLRLTRREIERNFQRI